ncbi:hypothetical protein ACIOTI_23270 [Streptomyces sp. NPDC087843]|uniref:phosphotriesterase family protein n=1 Tax=Streptomyces sp. NPDC087843 TaxID=3365804 RepID=UPI00381B3513
MASSGRASQRRNTTSASRKGIGEPPCQGGGFARASVAGTGRAGRFEEGLTPGVERVMRAVAQAHVRTGLPITVHTCAVARTGLVAQEILRREGVDLATVVIGHSGDTDDQDYLHRLIDNGSYVGTDRFGLDILLPGDRRVSGVAPLGGRPERSRTSAEPTPFSSDRPSPSTGAEDGAEPPASPYRWRWWDDGNPGREYRLESRIHREFQCPRSSDGNPEKRPR